MVNRKVEVVTDFLFLGSKITADGDCSHEIRRHLPLGRKAITNLDSVLKSSDITLLTKICIVKAMVFPVVMYGCESWTIKKAECQRIDAFELWCWRRLLRVPWTARRFNQSILKEISPKYSLEGLVFCHPTISSFVIPFSSCFQFFPASASFLKSVLHIRWPKYWSFSFNISPSNEYLGLISFRMD